jgi:hypothetical protein
MARDISEILKAAISAALSASPFTMQARCHSDAIDETAIYVESMGYKNN